MLSCFYKFQFHRNGAGRNSHLLFRPATNWMLDLPVSIAPYNGLPAETLLAVAGNSTKEKRRPPPMKTERLKQQLPSQKMKNYFEDVGKNTANTTTNVSAT